MTRIFLTSVLLAVCAAPAGADVTIKQTTTGKGMGMGGTMPGVAYIKGLKMRSEIVMGDSTRVTIFDVEAQKMYSFDTTKKEADVWDMQSFGAEMSKAVDVSAMTSSLKPNGQTKQLGGQAAIGYDMEVTVPSQMGGPGGPKIIVKMVGPMWVVKDAPGTREYLGFYRAAVEKGWIFSDPRAAKGSPGQAKAMAEIYKQLSETGGVPYQTDMQIKLDGEGPMAAMMAKMGGMTSSTVVESIITGPLADDLFAPPAGYKLNSRK
jgi:hypothetical protein